MGNMDAASGSFVKLDVGPWRVPEDLHDTGTAQVIGMEILLSHGCPQYTEYVKTSRFYLSLIFCHESPGGHLRCEFLSDNLLESPGLMSPAVALSTDMYLDSFTWYYSSIPVYQVSWRVNDLNLICQDIGTTWDLR